MSRSALFLIAVISSGCTSDWRTDMWYQVSLRPEDAPRPQPEGSVPLDAEPTYDGREETADLENPVPGTPSSLAHGKALFVARCAPCHGAEGHGGVEAHLELGLAEDERPRREVERGEQVGEAEGL